MTAASLEMSDEPLFYRAKVLWRQNAKYRFANNSLDLTTAFHECAISGISLTPCLFTCLISLVP